MSQAAALQKLDGVYGLRQPGFAPHPILKHRQQQRNELRRSASLVLAQNRSPALSIPVPAVRDAERPVDYADWSTHMMPPVSLQPLKGGNWPTWVEPAFVNQVPLRLEDCQARLTAVERELERYKQIAAGGSGFKAVKLQHAVFDHFAPANAHGGVGVFHSASAPQLHTEKSLAVPPAAQSMQKSGSFTTGEPAPEPSMTGSLSFLDVEAGRGLDIDLDTELEGVEELDEDDDLPAKLSVIQGQLLEMDQKWQAVHENREFATMERGEMEATLKAGHEYEQELVVEVADLTARVEQSETKTQALRDALGVSEGKAKELRNRKDSLKVQEQALEAQAAALRERISSLEGQASELRGQLADEGAEEEPEGGRGRAAACESAADHATSLESIEEEVRKTVAAELERERLLSEQRRAKLEKELEAAVERHRLTEAELERLATAEPVSAAPQPADEGTPAPPDASAAPAGADDEPAEQPSAEEEEGQEAEQTGTEGLTELALPNASPIPELVFVADLTQGDGGVGGQGGAQAPAAAPLPAKCQIDLASNELCLQGLAPVGPSHRVPLASIAAATRPDGTGGSVLELELEAAAAKAFNAPLRLATGDAHAASALLAALELPNRVLPGFGLGTAA